MSDSLLDFSSLEKTKLVKLSHKKRKSIKNISSINPGELDSSKIVEALKIKFLNHKYQINNVYIYAWESDFFTVSESGYIYEIEIKVTRSDFKDDFNKLDKHTLLENKQPVSDLKRPNKFYYAAPRNLLATYMIPEYAGLIEIDPDTLSATIAKEAPFLHKEKGIDHIKDILLDKFYYRYRDLSGKK